MPDPSPTETLRWLRHREASVLRQRITSLDALRATLVAALSKKERQLQAGQ